MYLFDSMIDMSEEKWQSNTHRNIAIKIAIGNPQVNNMDTMTDVCRVVNSVSKDKIKVITYNQLIEMGLPDVW